MERPIHRIPATVGAWLVYVAIDFLGHGVLFAKWWEATANYWRPRLELFQFIPFGYAAFLIYCAALVWLLYRLYGGSLTLARGSVAGALAGLVLGIYGTLASYSVFPMPRSALLVWPAWGALESAAAGATGTWILAGRRPWLRVLGALGVALAIIFVGILVQNIPGVGMDRH